MIAFVLSLASGLIVAPAQRRASLAGVSLTRVSDGTLVDIGAAVAAPACRTLLVLGTHAADFNAIEYAQKCRHYLPALKDKGVERTMLVLNSEASACTALVDLLSLPGDIEVFADPFGEAGRSFGVNRGWMPDSDLNPYLKEYLMLFGVGPSQTLPAVITGYLGNPWGKREWIETALEQGQRAGRWPSNVLELVDNEIVNNFDSLPLVGSWGRRPLELATLRLQNLIGVAFNNWERLKPLHDPCLTQLGGCMLVGEDSNGALYAWVDGGICDVPDFDEILAAL